jgi:hypothetical protein
MNFLARTTDKGWRVIAVSSVDIVAAAAAESVTLTDANSVGAEIHNAGVNTIFISNTAADATAYELREGERMFLAGVISVFSTDGSTLKIMRVA